MSARTNARSLIGHSGGMVGYTAFTAVEPETGLGVVILQNGSGSKEGVVDHAFDAVRACITDTPLPDVWAPPEPTAIPDADRFAGEYADPERRGCAPGPDGRRRAPGHDRRGVGASGSATR